jgi:hypothetical protein
MKILGNEFTIKSVGLVVTGLLIVLLIMYTLRVQMPNTTELHKQITRAVTDISLSRPALKTDQQGTDLENFKVGGIVPENRVMDQIAGGESLRRALSIHEDPLSLDEVLVKNTEKYVRSMTSGDVDGPQLEGMYAPLDEFEQSAMNRQAAVEQSIYG